MRILIVSNLFAPDFCGGAAQFTDLAIGLKARGHDVWVYAAYPYYPEWVQKSGRRFFQVGYEDIDGLNVIRHALYVPKNPSDLKQRLLFEISFAVVLLRSLFRKPRADVTIVFCPPLGSVLFGIMRKLFRREKLWINIQDIPTDASLASGIAKAGLFSKLAASLQAFLFRRADIVTTISPAMQNRLNEIIGSRHKVEVCPNWLISTFQLVAKAPPKPDRSPTVPIRLLYCGNIGRKQGLLEFCKVIQESNANFEFTIRGDGAAKRDLQHWHETTGDVRFKLLGFLDDHEFVSAIADADLFVVTEKPNAGFSFIPSKLIPAISIGTPLLVISDTRSPLGQECNENSLGLHLDWQRLPSINESLANLTADDLCVWSANCLNRAVFYTRESAIDRYEEILSDLVSNANKVNRN